MILVAEPANAPPDRRYLVVQVDDAGMRLARCPRRELADNIARAWRDQIYTIPGEVRRWTCQGLSSSSPAAHGTASTGRTSAAATTQPRH